MARGASAPYFSGDFMAKLRRVFRQFMFYLISRVFPKRLTQFLMYLTQAKFVVAVVVVLYHGNQILLLRHSYRPRYPWGLVTGWVKAGESPKQAASREVFEELGIEIAELHYFYSEVVGRHHLEIGFWAMVDAANDSHPSGDGEILESAWFSVHQLPEGLLPSQRPLILQAENARIREFS
ncbi:NUDIX hydrolase [Sulfobacillus thermosulfidooxidans]|nr:NUDIX domain-containing protein [Sulfobacillus thermosulfidooxidans]